MKLVPLSDSGPIQREGSCVNDLMKNFDGIEKRRPNWGKREWLNFARLQTQDLDNAKETIELLNGTLDKVHRYAVHQWSEGKMDGWLKIMQLADPDSRKALNPDD